MSQDLKKGTSWRTLFKRSEDLLTATVFERLSYLPAKRFYDILSETFGFSIEEIEDNTKLIKLKTIEFWPRWEDVTDHAFIVEPDVFLCFCIQETDQMIDVIIEAKPFDTGTLQYKTQWERQILSYATMAIDLAEPTIGVKFLALGGLGFDTDLSFSRLEKEFYETCDKTKLPENLDMKGCSWSALLNICEKLKNLTEFESRIISDILEALSLSGYSKRSHFNDLLLGLSHHDLDASLQQIKYWEYYDTRP